MGDGKRFIICSLCTIRDCISETRNVGKLEHFTSPNCYVQLNKMYVIFFTWACVGRPVDAMTSGTLLLAATS